MHVAFLVDGFWLFDWRGVGVYNWKKERGEKSWLKGSERQWEYLGSYMKDQKLQVSMKDTRTRNNPLREILYTRR